jgi:putative SOS response-associated peptidase YedK
MCFTVKMTADALRLEQRYGVKANPKTVGPAGTGRRNAFEHPYLPMVLQDSIQMGRWGLIPEWVKDREQALEIQNKTLNARAETALNKASFHKALRQRRCIVPVESFFEWEHRGKTKVPYEISSALEEFLSLAGIWEVWTAPESKKPVVTLSLLTCEANPLMAKIHNTKLRMPVVIAPETIPQWLDPTLPEGMIQELLQPYPDAWLRAECLEQFLL